MKLPKKKKNRNPIKILIVITDVITWLIVICVMVVVGALYLPKLFHTEPFIVLSGSMEPTIQTGSLVYITKTEEEPKIGDIVAYMAGDDVPVVHRIVGHEDDSYILKGDANDDIDMNEVYPSQIIGKFAKTIPKAGYLLSTIRSHTISIGAISIPAIIPLLLGIVIILHTISCLAGQIAYEY